ncbi:MAG: AAA family ATPase [Bacteroidetes bacterium]|nr:AAA family ATPase [Bacteroidota bacterium]
MRIKKLELKNFRGFEDLTIDFPDGESGLAVFVGVNGSGKTSVLDSILNAVHLYFYHLVRFQSPRNEEAARLLYHRILGKKDINIDKKEFTLNTTFGFDDLGVVVFRHEQSENGYFQTWPESGDIRLSDDSIEDKEEKGLEEGKFLEEKFLTRTPFFKYYPTSRYASQQPSLEADDSVYNRGNILLSAFENRLDFNDFFKWFRNVEDFEHEQRLNVNPEYRYLALESLRKVTSTLLPGIEKPRVKRRPKEELTIEKEGKELPFIKLSDGEKSLFTLAGDIIRRIFLTFAYDEYITPTDVLMKSGIVLIDEIEQHLHPAWQRTIIPNLRRTFPNIQFILTTHSPQVLSSVPTENVFVLKDFKLRKFPPYHTEDRDSNSILEEVFEVEARPEDGQKDLKALYDYIDKNDRKNAEQKLEELKEKYGSTDSELVRAEMYVELMDE